MLPIKFFTTLTLFFDSVHVVFNTNESINSCTDNLELAGLYRYSVVMYEGYIMKDPEILLACMPVVITVCTSILVITDWLS